MDCNRILFFVFSVFALQGCSSEPPKTSGPGYHESKYFSINFPTNWDIIEDYLPSGIIAKSPLESPEDLIIESVDDLIRASVNVTVVDLTRALSLETFVKKTQENQKRILNNNDYKLLEEGEITIQGVKSRWYINSHLQGPVKLKVIVYQFVNKKRGYTIYCMAQLEAFSEYKKEFEKIAQSFKIK